MKYICNYAGTEDNVDGRFNSPAGDCVSAYMISVLYRLDPTTDFVSTAASNRQKGFFAARWASVNGIRVKLFRTSGARSKISRGVRWYLRQWRLFFYLLTHAKRDEIVIAYHALDTIGVITRVKKIKKFRLILQTEELYSDVKPTIDAPKERKFVKQADAYLFPTATMGKIGDNKPFIIKHGAYTIPQKCGKSFDDGKIHVVYAGTFDPTKGGCQAAAAAAQYLDARFHVHILGFGTETETENIKTIVEKVSKETQCVLTYDGLLQGEAFVEFLQSCDIGLSTQNPDAAYNDTSFPSKVLTYLSNGLKVVTIRIKALETSKVGDLLYYYDTQTPQSIADAIRLAATADDRQNGLDRIAALDIEFGKELGKLIQTVSRMKKR